MKESIYTIPVNDAFDEGGECPFCNIKRKLETESVDYVLGTSYMQDDIRAETDKLGFCKRHYSMLYKKQNRLGLAMIMQTHLQKIRNDIEKLGKLLTTDKKKLFSRSKIDNLLADYIKNITESCYICSKIDDNFERYIDTFFYMWKKDNDIREKVKVSKGFCLEHFGMLVNQAEKKLSAKEYKEFVNIVLPLQLENTDRLLGELEHFTNKFDYNYADVPWNGAEDALIRGILKISSEFTED